LSRRDGADRLPVVNRRNRPSFAVPLALATALAAGSPHRAHATEGPGPTLPAILPEAVRLDAEVLDRPATATGLGTGLDNGAATGTRYASAAAYEHFLKASRASIRRQTAAAITELRQALVHDAESASLHATLAIALLDDGQLADAAIVAARGLTFAPDNARLWALKGQALFASDRPAAEEALTRAVALDPADRESRLDLVALRLLRQDDAAALAVLTAAATPPARSAATTDLAGAPLADALFDLAALRWQLGDALGAAGDFQRALAIDAGHIDAGLALASLHEAQGRPAEAQRILNGLLFIHPDDWDIMAQLIRVQLRTEPTLTRTAQALIDRVIQIGEAIEAPSMVHLRIGVLMFQERRFALAKTQFEAALKANRRNDYARLYLGYTHDRLRDRTGAEAAFRPIELGSPVYVEALSARMQSVADRGAHAVAVRMADTALKADLTTDERIDIVQAKALLLADSGRRAEALALLQRTEQSVPLKFHPELAYAEALVLEKLGDQPAMEAALRRAIMLNPAFATALNHLGYAWADRGENLDEAMGLLKMAVALAPENGYIADSLGWVFFRRGEFAKARALLERAVALSPHQPTILMHLGDACAKTGEPARAQALYRRAIASGPDATERKDLATRLK
jgi:tetratricopeptide (TPR) repeat protein